MRIRPAPSGESPFLGIDVANGTVLIGYGVQLGGLARFTHANPSAAGGIVAYTPRH
jgi:hypothetical protein